MHLAFVKVSICTNTYEIQQVLDTRLLDLTDIPHSTVPFDACRLKHSCQIFDRVQHLIQEYKHTLFDQIDVVLLEQQPIGGITSVEQLLFGYFREKVVMVSPRSMHCYFQISKLDYEQRKESTTKMATPYLQHCSDWQNNTRQHDMADALCMILFYLHQIKQRRRRLLIFPFSKQTSVCEASKQTSSLSRTDVDKFFQQFSYPKFVKVRRAQDFLTINDDQ